MSQNQPTLLVTGASGNLGRLVVENLLQTVEANRIIATSRQPEKLKDLAAKGVQVRLADFERPETLDAAFAGADRILIVSTDQVGARVQGHQRAIKAAQQSGAQHILYTSLPNAERIAGILASEHAATEKTIRESGLNYTLLRHNLYFEVALQTLTGGYERGQMAGVAGKGQVAYVSREDCARAAAAALISAGSENREFDITGSEAFNYDQLAKILSEITNRQIGYLNIEEDQFKSALVSSGVPADFAQIIIDFDVAAKDQHMGHISTAFQDLTGTQPSKLTDYLLQNKSILMGKK
ncbi:SDR family oxidoreductase [Pseudobdellovibrio exovorus]|uniref:NAD(P)-binding domain-containing protein n=1 Tax=Pseudobdellovibrio exovorus JSS TaxID=1184267 RepID=M4V7W2_9BACT|nr:SDR family oxidoreductase [Pseudobdellovibrio exovorus]AGH94515.1 hypothetical protein A11Q_295 [Pseudobdellovibrio exovorus JSS]